MEKNNPRWVKDADLYFHCKANCQASEDGIISRCGAKVISDAREIVFFYPNLLKGTPIEAEIKNVFVDQDANIFGREAPHKKGFNDCESTCLSFIAPDQHHKFVGPRLRGRFRFD